MPRLLQLWDTWRCWKHWDCQSPRGILVLVSNLETLNATRTEQLKETRDMLGKGKQHSRTSHMPKTLPCSSSALPQPLLLLWSRSELLKVSVNLLGERCNTPSPSLQESMPFIWSGWTPSQPPMLGGHSSEPPKLRVPPAQALP